MRERLKEIQKNLVEFEDEKSERMKSFSYRTRFHFHTLITNIKKWIT